MKHYLSILLSMAFIAALFGSSLSGCVADREQLLGGGETALSGKTVVCFGDSILGMVRDETSITSYIEKETGATVYNAGFGGCRMSSHPSNSFAPFCMWTLAKAIAEDDWTAQETHAPNGPGYFPAQMNLLRSIDFNTVDIAVIHYGTNDFTADHPAVQLDSEIDSYDCTTLCGALRYSIETLLEAYPHLQIYVSLPVYRYWPEENQFPETLTNSLGKTLSDYVEAIRSTAEAYGLMVIDCYYGPNIDQENIAQMTTDGVHPSHRGRQRLGRFIGQALIAAQKTD